MVETEKILFKITVEGRVQGVGFRHSAASIARYSGINGFVRNESDGSVYIEAEGTQEQLEKFIKWCQKGPGMGYVESVRWEKAEAKGYGGFGVRY